MSKTLNIIGAGNVGKTLGRLWSIHQTFAIQDVMCRSLDSAQRAVTFIGAGRAVDKNEDLRRADVYMITTPDDRIAAICASLAEASLFSNESIVFHCSGALRSTELQAAHGRGAATASVHPIRSFAMPGQVAKNFAGTFCGVEGDPQALEVLASAFSAIGAQLVPILSESKVLYHAASVFACNYLTTLLDVAKASYVKSGIPPDVALKLMEPLVRETVDNIFRIGTANALTGPVARGDMQTAERQRKALAEWDARYARLYADFIELTSELARKKQRPED
ncbi:Rossmann-like and DUF2520 domain-containing protein [Noviherbaspirillum massiliense]|uniref:Rossmann-like and DUF2520 domain-containing protein n=1 Tax=Noviherbaspirillum massiliense TaxID=1465823 RepID=UPI0002D2A125|nr:Rossmann-like and DUF2520 domain-containing protein [Noviherbaspirillum massiliense]